MKISYLKRLLIGIACLGVVAQAAQAAEVVNVDIKYANEHKSLADYTKFNINALDTSHTKVIPAPWLNKKTFKWDVSEKNVEVMHKNFEKSLTAALSRGGKYKVVNEDGKGVLSIHVQLISFMPYVAKEDEEATTQGSGDIRVNITMRDGATGELVLMVEGVEQTGADYQPNTELARKESAKELFKNWGDNLRAHIDDAHKRAK